MEDILGKIISTVRATDLFYISLVISLLSGLLPLIQNFLAKKVSGEAKLESYSEKLERLTRALLQSSEDMDKLLAELATVARDRATAVERLESDLQKLEDHEQQLKRKVEDLQAVPIPVAEHFAALMAKGERRSAWRDYILFGLGVVVSTIIAVLLRAFNLG
jgi:septal ring factor EnvC (AmiA/AmiB activator)